MECFRQMIARIRGKVWEAYPNRLILDVQGVGYEVHVPLSTFDHLHPSEGAVVELRTYLHIREAAHTLRQAAEMAQRVDCLLSGDDDEDAFLRRWDIKVRDYYEKP